MDDLKKMIYGKQDYYLDFLSKLVGFDTSVIRHGEDGQEGAAQMYMAGFLERLGCEVDIFEPDNERMKAYPGYNQGPQLCGKAGCGGDIQGNRGREVPDP